MSEFAGFFAENTHPEYSSRGGTVMNPYNPLISPSGSSSGSAVAVSANLCTVAVETETAGSIVSPARANCIVGIKPTVGLISRSGIIPISNSQDTAGPMARTVSDAAILLQAMIGVDKDDPATWKSKWLAHGDYVHFLDKDKVANLRVGVYMLDFQKYSDEEKALMSEAIDVLLTYGVKIVKLENDCEGLLIFKGSSVLTYEFKSGIDYYLSNLNKNTNIKCLNDLISFNNRNSDTCLKYGQKTLEDAEKTSGTLTEDEYICDRLMDIEDARVKGIDKIVNEFDLDALLFFGCTSVADISGYPCIFVPVGFLSNGKAQGFTFVGKAFSEPTIISLAYAYEQSTKKRTAPVLV